MIASIAVDEALLALKIAFLVFLYLFVWAIIRSATRDLKAAPQESIVLGRVEADALRNAVAASAAKTNRLRVVASPALAGGTTIDVRGSLSVGRGPENGLRLESDEVVSSRHARLEAGPAGLYIEDSSSTNGTFVNGARVSTPCLLRAGDVVRIGHTELEVVA